MYYPVGTWGMPVYQSQEGNRMEFTKRTVQLPHCETETISVGQGSPSTIVTSGGLQGGYEWPRDSGLGENLARIGTFVGWNRRFHKGAKGPFCIQTLETNAIDLVHIMDAHGMKTANLVGSSFGSSTSLMAAFWFPQRVEKLVLFHPTRISGPEHLQKLNGDVERWESMLAEHGITSALQTEGFCYSFPPDRDDLNGGTVSDMDVDEFAAIVAESYRRFGTHRCAVLGLPGPMLRAIDKQALILPGNDEIHPPEAADDLADLLPNGRLAETPLDEDGIPPRLMEEIMEFLVH